MPLGDAIAVTGLVLQIAGVGTTGWGARKTWEAFAPEDEGIWDPMRAALARARQRVASQARRLLRKKRSVTVHAGAATVSASASARARGRKQFRTIPDDIAVAEALRELDGRTRELMDKVNNIRDRLEDDATERRDAERRLRAELQEEIERLDQQDRHVALGGLRLEATGLLLVALGAVLQGVGTWLL